MCCGGDSARSGIELREHRFSEESRLPRLAARKRISANLRIGRGLARSRFRLSWH